MTTNKIRELIEVQLHSEFDKNIAELVPLNTEETTIDEVSSKPRCGYNVNFGTPYLPECSLRQERLEGYVMFRIFTPLSSGTSPALLVADEISRVLNNKALKKNYNSSIILVRISQGGVINDYTTEKARVTEYSVGYTAFEKFNR